MEVPVQGDRLQPQGEPARKKAPPPLSPYRRGDQATVFAVPAGHTLTVKAEPTSTGFVGRSFAMDSLEFLRWAAVYFHDDALSLRVVIFLMGSQEPGGLIKATQEQLAKTLQAHRVHVNRSMRLLVGLGLVHMVKRGVYQLNPQASLRGGVTEVEEAEPRRSHEKLTRKIDQLAIIDAFRHDPKALEEFKWLELPKPAPRRPRNRKKPAEPDTSEE